MENQRLQDHLTVTSTHISSATQKLLTPSDSDNTSSVDLLEELKFECERRQQEIYQNDNLTIQIATYILAFSGVVMGFVIPSKDIDDSLKILICMFVGWIAYLGLRQHIGRTQSTYINAAYQRVFIETKTREVKWETRLAKFRANPPKSGVIDTVSDLGLLYGGIILANMLVCFYYLWEVSKNNISSMLLSILMILAAALVTFLWYKEWSKYSLFDDQKMEEYIRAWERVKDKG